MSTYIPNVGAISLLTNQALCLTRETITPTDGLLPVAVITAIVVIFLLNVLFSCLKRYGINVENCFYSRRRQRTENYTRKNGTKLN